MSLLTLYRDAAQDDDTGASWITLGTVAHAAPTAGGVDGTRTAAEIMADAASAFVAQSGKRSDVLSLITGGTAPPPPDRVA